jgi:hypothetical protein
MGLVVNENITRIVLSQKLAREMFVPSLIFGVRSKIYMAHRPVTFQLMYSP